MHTPPTRALELEPQDRLPALLTIYPTRWPEHVMAAAHALPDEETRHLAPAQWVILLDLLELALDPVVSTLHPASIGMLRAH